MISMAAILSASGWRSTFSGIRLIICCGCCTRSCRSSPRRSGRRCRKMRSQADRSQEIEKPSCWRPIRNCAQSRSFPEAAADMEKVMAVINAIRNIRGEMEVPPSKEIAVILSCASEASRLLMKHNEGSIIALARIGDLAIGMQHREAGGCLHCRWPGMCRFSCRSRGWSMWWQRQSG